MHVFHSLINAVLVIALLYAIALTLKSRRILEETHSMILARIVTDLCLPAVVFLSLARQSIGWKQLEPAGIMLFLEILSIALAWWISHVLGFNRPRQGAIVFCSAFGSSTFLGYAIIMQMYPGNPEAMTEAVLISELGVGYPIFILGPMLAAYFGSGERGNWRAGLSFFRSPVFVALLAGVLWGWASLPGKENMYLQPFFHMAEILASALTPLAILAVGLLLKRPRLRDAVIALAVVAGIKLLLKPFLAGSLSMVAGMPDLWQDVLVLLAAMPPAVLGVVFLKRYGGDAGFASTLLLAATILSSVTLIGVFAVTGMIHG